jgi:two-component system, NtrC family, sensor histidine kinase HydH
MNTSTGQGQTQQQPLQRSEGTFFWTRRFALLSFLCVVLTALVSATFLSSSVAERMVNRNAELAQEFLDSLVRMHRSDLFFENRNNTEGIERLFGELARMPGLVHANVFDIQRSLVWSTNPEAIGRDVGANEELDEALKGELALESELLKPANFIKPEHAFVPNKARDAIEVYIPVRDAQDRVVGVAELYMLPQRLIESIHEMTRYVWLACAGSGLLIYMALVGLVMQADRQIAQQQRTIVANESLVAVGDMASAVAHGLRNPLASIRSSAELIALGPDNAQANDIMSEVDRLQAWIAKLLAYAQQGGRALTPVNLGQLFDTLLKSHAARMSKAGVTMTRDWPDDLPRVRADAPALEQALDNLIGNALDAMPQGGELRLKATAQGEKLQITVSDNGVGMSAADLDRVFTPFHTTKRTGLGVGLPLAKRSIERLGGRLTLQSRLGEGTMAIVQLPMHTRAR